MTPQRGLTKLTEMGECPGTRNQKSALPQPEYSNERFSKDSYCTAALEQAARKRACAASGNTERKRTRHQFKTPLDGYLFAKGGRAYDRTHTVCMKIRAKSVSAAAAHILEPSLGRIERLHAYEATQGRIRG